MWMRSFWRWYEYTLRRWLMLDEIGLELTQPWPWLLLWVVATLVGFALWRSFRNQPPSRWAGLIRSYAISVLVVGLTGVSLAMGAHVRAQEQERIRKLRFVLSEDPILKPPLVVESLPVPSVPFSAVLLQQLTRGPWLELDCHGPGRPVPSAPCERFELLSDGTFRRGPAVPEAGQPGGLGMSWDMRASGADTGVIALEEGTLLFFELRNGTELHLDGRTYRQAPRTTPSGAASPGFAARPPPLAILQAFEELVSTPWSRRDPEFLAGRNLPVYERLPERVSFHPNGSFEATYQQGACVHRGTFQVTTGSLVPSWEGNPCVAGEPQKRDGRNRPSRFGWMENGKLALREAFYPAGLLGEPGMFLIDPLVSEVTLKGQLSSKLQRGVPTPLAVTLRFSGEYRVKKLRSLSLAMRERIPPEERPARKPRTQLLVSKDLGGRPLTSARNLLQEQVVLTPEFSGPVELRVVLAFEDPQLPHWLDRTYLTEVGE